jgi:F-type H+-transporting ATPase subunit c
MKRKLMFAGATLMALASPIFAQPTGGAASGATDWRLPFAYLAVGIASGLCGLGQGKAVASSCEAMARNPGAAAGIRFALILGLALIESLGLYALFVTYIAK